MTQDLHSTVSNQSKESKSYFRVIRKEEEHLYFSKKITEGRWTKNEHKIFLDVVLKNGIRNWKKVKYFLKIFLKKYF
jgi:hypothetical protein